MKKKLCSILLALTMVLTLLPVSALADVGTPAEAPAGESTPTEAPAASNVAKIGNQENATLAKAVEAAESGATITLLNDVALDSTLTLDKNLILDLNGHVISNGNNLGTNYLVKVANGAEVSIIGNKENSSINDTRTNSTGTITAICVFGNLTVDGAELTISRGVNGIAIKVDESGADKLGKLTVKSGKISSTQAIQNWGITTIDGGTFTGDVGSHAYSNIGGDLTINDGIFNGPVYSAQLKYNASWPTAQAKAKIVNGTFNGVVAEYYDDGTNGLQPVERSDKPAGDVNCKVTVNGGTFSNLSCVKYMTADAKVTVDLNGKTVSGDADFYAGDLTIKNGTVGGTVWVNASATDAEYNHLTVAADATIGKGDYAVVLYQAMVGANNFGSTIDVYGKLNGILWVMGNIKTDLKTAQNPCVINVHDGAEIEDKTNATNVGIALNGAAILNVDKAMIAGSTGIEVRAGQMTLNGATVTGKAAPMVVKPNENGVTTDGAGIAVAQHTTKLPIEVTINSGAISGYTAFYESNPQNNAAEDLAKINIAVKGGNFKTINDGTVAVYSANKTGFISGGTYTSDPSAYVAPGYVASYNGSTYTVYYPVPVIPNNNNNSSSTTTKNPDGSTTTTTTDKATGAVTETTTTANGSVGTVKTDANGSTEISASISAADVKAAEQKNAPVIAPITVAPAASSAAAPVIKLSVPANAGEVAVAIPVVNAKQGTVAIKVNPDGTEEIIKTAVVTENGLVLGVKGSMQIKVINNDKNFVDTVGHWAASDVDFVSARELFNGTAPALFSPEASMTRGMVVTVIARLAGENTDGGANWYDKGCAWAVANGVSDGTNPNGSITREQLAAMLYRYCGSPAASGSLSTYADAASVSAFGADAMQWCVNNGIINGMDGLLNPQGQATRAQVSAMFARYIRLEAAK